MYCTKKVTDDLTWVGGNDRRLAMFEGVYSVPDGVSYNSYLLTDESTVLFDTVDKAVARVFFENIEAVLSGRKLDYLVVHHMEPDHSATIAELLLRHPETTIICTAAAKAMISQFFGADCGFCIKTVSEGEKLVTGRHTLQFFTAPMVHWPEVMVTYDETDGILFSADAFGTFGALNGAIFADEVDFMRDYLDEARRYYCNIVGKYGAQVRTLLGKAEKLDIRMICPLHGFVWRRNLNDYIDKYRLWSGCTPEKKGVMIAYASVYGNTENAAEILSSRLRDSGCETVMYDVSVTPASEIVAAAFKWSHFVFASTTYNAGIFISMDELLRDLAAHGIHGRTVAFIENGSWAATAGKQMRGIISECRDITVLDQTVSLKSSLKPGQSEDIDRLVSAILESDSSLRVPSVPAGDVDPKALFSLSYGLFVLSAREGERDNACIINTAQQLTDNPRCISITVNKRTLTHDMICSTGVFNLSVLTEQTPYSVFQRFGFASGRDTDKFAGYGETDRTVNGLSFVPEYSNAVLSCRVINELDCGTHTLFTAALTEARVLSSAPSATYAYYFANIKPSASKTSDPVPETDPVPAPAAEKKVKRYICRICGYIYEGEELPDDFECPICGHGPDDFEPLD
ncbi:MAG: flavin reductase [Clostridiales bacterium]|nr:flavin reductase [Clostridiales bacterium]